MLAVDHGQLAPIDGVVLPGVLRVEFGASSSRATEINFQR
jgi:hypothetical protein